MVNYIKVRFDDNPWHDNYGEKLENVNCKSNVDEFIEKKRKLIFNKI